MFGIVSSTTERAGVALDRLRAEVPHPLEARLIDSGDVALGFLFDAGSQAREGFYRAEDDGGCAVISGSIGDDGRMLKGDDAAALLVGLTRGGSPGLRRDLTGLFAAAVWHADEARLTLVCDWIGGIHQLFYVRLPDGLICGTEARVLAKCGAWDYGVNQEALAQYLDFGHSLPPGTLFDGILKLPAGCELTFRDSDLEVRRTFLPRFAPQAAGGDAARLLRDTHREAVARCMRSARVSGAFLSGGLDSSLNVAAMSELSDAPIETFCVTYPGESIDEARYARLVADHFNTEHHELALKSAAVLDELPEMIWALEEPAMDYSFIPTFSLIRFARRYVPAVISGDGPDHLFGRHHPVALMRSTLGRLPGARRLAAALVAPPPRGPRAVRLWRSLRRMDSGRLLWKALQSVACDTEQAYLAIYREIGCRGILPERARSLLMHPEQLPAGNEQTPPLVAGTADEQMTESEQIIALDLSIDGSCGVFSKVGKMAGYHGLSVYEPYLDTGFRDLVEALPSDQKARGSLRDLLCGRLSRKVLLQEAARGVLPDEIVHKPKQGFQAPIGAWLSEWIHARDAGELLPALTRQTALLHEASVNAILREHTDGVRDHGTLIMMLITLDLWYAIFVLGHARKPDWSWSDRLGR